jgi:two-component system nitrogen regulation response regulator GlnG
MLPSVSREDPSTIAAVPTPGRAAEDGDDAAVPALTIIWHPDARRVGDVAPLPRGRVKEISRKTPPFDATADVVLSRSPFLTVTEQGRAFEVIGSGSTPVIASGRSLAEALRIEREQLRAGVILTVGGSVVVCLHSIRAPILRGPPLGLVGGSDAIEAVRRQITKVADLTVPALIRGETGTGKELVARAIASGGARPVERFVAVNMAAIPPSTAADELFGHERGAFTGASDARGGYFAEADGGTLFLDEIAATPPDVQKMLLRVLETGELRPLGGRRARKVDVRVLAATDEDLEAAVRDGRFAEPLLHRLAGYQIRLPPLRERREDVGVLFVHFLRQELAAVGEPDRLDPRDAADRPWLGASEVARLASSALVGNVRGLRNIARQLVISSRGQRFAELDSTFQASLTAMETGGTQIAPARATKVSDEQIREALRKNNYNFSAAADELGIHRSTLYDRVRQNPQDVRSASEISDDELLESHARHGADIAAMAAELRASPKPLKARLTEALARRRGTG